MWKVRSALILLVAFICYSFVIYSQATDIQTKSEAPNALVQKGKEIYQSKNCVSCHQVYGLGGYLGPDLTTIYGRYPDENYIRAMLVIGNKNMPVYNFTPEELDALLAYFKYLNQHPAYGQK